MKKLCELMYEDELPEMTDEEYDEWYEKSSVVYGVRMGPIFKRVTEECQSSK